jgi:hypothetical protein
LSPESAPRTVATTSSTGANPTGGCDRTWVDTEAVAAVIDLAGYREAMGK